MKKGNLELIHSVRIPEVELQKRFEALNNSGFNCGSLAKAIQTKDEIYQQFKVSGIQSINEMVLLTKRYILHTLEEDSATVDLQRVHPQLFLRWAKNLQTSDDPKAVIEEISQSLHEKAECVMTREQLEEKLKDHCGVMILNEDVTRLLVHDLNSRHFIPRVLGLINRRKPYNPLYVRTTVSGPLSTEARDILRSFNH